MRFATGAVLLALHLAVPPAQAATTVPAASEPLRVVTTPVAPLQYDQGLISARGASANTRAVSAPDYECRSPLPASS
jgi:hypothetical protein